MRSLTCSVPTGPNSEVGHVAGTPYMIAVEVILVLIYSLDILNQMYFRLSSKLIPFVIHFFYQNVFVANSVTDNE